jgi:hypothetical protein
MLARAEQSVLHYVKMQRVSTFFLSGFEVMNESGGPQS